ncbi:MAG TPA: transglycosylase SLT domain-containing protein, partial [Longimicrobiales bacterium]|nr:transglycosylase SLT domain-containing protein [Longimicrobiales bacterium]
RSGYTGLRAWRARVAAAERAGDHAAARSLANQARAWARTNETKSEFYVAAARAAIAMGDADAGRAALRAAIDLGAASQHARAAAELLQNGPMSPADHLAVARVLRAQGLHAEAVPGYRAWLESGAGSARERAAVHIEHATALFYAGRYDEVDAALAPVVRQAEARFLLARAASHRGEPDRAVAIYLALASEFAGTGNGAQALYLAASTRHDQGDLEGARELYGQVVNRYPGRSQMGLAMMRLAGIAFLEGNHDEAARLWERYRSSYPRGSHWLEATYWSGRARIALGDTATAAARFRAVRERDRESYYALLASRQLGESFWPLPMSPGPTTPPATARRVDDWMRGVDLLRAAGFTDEAAAEADRIADAAGMDRATLYALAEALVARGFARRAIQIGLYLDAREPRNERLMRILYPFPYRELIVAEANARGVDPFTAAALIRQESLFEARITSPAGARGLMQIMPATGEMLAAAAGIESWDAEALYQPEINVHLGTRYLAEHLARYGGSLPSVFSAYNAGPHRVQWWSAFPEYAQEELFTERIPYAETRDYVKILTRNRAIYRGLYAPEHGD